MRYTICLLVLFLIACAASRHTSQAVEPLASLPGAVGIDTTVAHLPDGVHSNRGANKAILAKLFTGKKIKRSTIIVQIGEKPVAVPVVKSKAPLAVSSAAPAQAIEKAKEPVAATTGSNSPISQTTIKKSVLFWWLLAVIAAFVCFYYYKIKK